MYDEDAEKYLYENTVNIGVIDGRYILDNNVLKTKSALTFVRYFREYNSQINYSEEFILDYILNFCGTDSDGTYYWTSYDNLILLFEKGGHFITSIQYGGEFAENLVTSEFSVDSEGNLYGLAIDDEEENYKLLRIKRSW